MKQYLLVVLLALCSCVRLDLERDIVAGQDSAVCWMTPLPDYRTNAREINALIDCN